MRSEEFAQGFSSLALKIRKDEDACGLFLYAHIYECVHIYIHFNTLYFKMQTATGLKQPATFTLKTLCRRMVIRNSVLKFDHYLA